jgi:hypothetical protein
MLYYTRRQIKDYLTIKFLLWIAFCLENRNIFNLQKLQNMQIHKYIFSRCKIRDFDLMNSCFPNIKEDI